MLSTSTSQDLATLLWKDREIYSARYQKSAAVLVAVQETLRHKLTLQADEPEFFALYDRVAAADGQVFARVWQDPLAYHWVRHAYQLVAHLIGGAEMTAAARQYWHAQGIEQPREALMRHLRAFKPFALATAYHAGEEILFETPYQAPSPFCLPASRWIVESKGALEIHGLRDNHLLFSSNQREFAVPLETESTFSTRTLLVRECPVLRFQAAEIPLNPFRFDFPGFEMAAALTHAGTDFQTLAVPRMVNTFNLLDTYAPDVLEQFLEVMQLLSLKAERRGSFTSTSHSELPGAFATTPSANAWNMADTLIHEFHHNRLFCLEDQYPIFDTSGGQSPNEGEYYSPWRDDLRPLHGVVHAVYVFTAVTRYWLRVYEETSASAPEHSLACDRILRYSRQLAMGLNILGQFAYLSAFGQEFLVQLRRDLAEINAEMQRLQLPADTPAWSVNEQGSLVPQRSSLDGSILTVARSVEEHRQLYDTRHQLPSLSIEEIFQQVICL